MPFEISMVSNMDHKKKPTLIKQEPKLKIAVFRRGGLGDGLYENMFIRNIKDHFKNSEIHAFIDIPFFPVLQGHPDCSQFHYVRWGPTIMTEMDVRNYYLDNYDIWFDIKPLQVLDGKGREGLWDINMEHRIRDIEGRYYAPNGAEMFDWYQEMGVNSQEEMFVKLFNIPVDLSKAYFNKAEISHSIRLPEKYATISAGWTFVSNHKSWTGVGWENICEYLNSKGICPVQLGKSDEPIIKGAMIATHLSLQQQYTVLSGSMFHMGCDGFLTHVAAMMNVPAVVLWGVTPWQIWGHANQYHVISPEFHNFWWSSWHWTKENRCLEIMAAISPEQVEEQIDKLMQERYA